MVIFNKANNLFFGLLALIIIACNPLKRNSSLSIETGEKDHTFVLPALPETLTDPPARANYLVTHYWDHFDFSDTVLIHLPAVSEQAFVDYIDVLPYSDKAVAIQSIQTTLASAEKEKTGKMYAYFLGLADKYLYDSNSPFHNDEFYIPVAEYILSDKRTAKMEKVRPSYRLSLMKKNKTGEIAADFAYTLPSGKINHLYDIKTNYTILLFYDPECHLCEELITSLKLSSIIQSIHRKGELEVLAVYPGDEGAAWKKRGKTIPENWINGQNTSIKKDELYDLKTIPTLYLLDKDKKVLLKDINFNTLEKWIEKNY
jgi:hypothetical protein